MTISTFGGALEGATFTAHPKIDSDTGELIGFGYEAKGLGSTDVEILSLDKNGKRTWHTWMTVLAYAGHDPRLRGHARATSRS